MSENLILKLLIGVVGLITILANFLVYLKQKSDLEKAKKELKEDLAHIQAVVERAYDRVTGDLGSAGAKVSRARETVGSDLGGAAKQAQELIGSLVQKKTPKSRS